MYHSSQAKPIEMRKIAIGSVIWRTSVRLASSAHSLFNMPVSEAMQRMMLDTWMPLERSVRAGGNVVRLCCISSTCIVISMLQAVSVFVYVGWSASFAYLKEWAFSSRGPDKIASIQPPYFHRALSAQVGHCC